MALGGAALHLPFLSFPSPTYIFLPPPSRRVSRQVLFYFRRPLAFGGLGPILRATGITVAFLLLPSLVFPPYGFTFLFSYNLPDAQSWAG